MVNFISIDEGCIELFNNSGDFIAAYRSPAMIADTIMKNGGPAPVIHCSSDWYYATEFGFDSQEELEGIWKEVCEYL